MERLLESLILEMGRHIIWDKQLYLCKELESQRKLQRMNVYILGVMKILSFIRIYLLKTCTWRVVSCNTTPHTDQEAVSTANGLIILVNRLAVFSALFQTDSVCFWLVPFGPILFRPSSNSALFFSALMRRLWQTSRSLSLELVSLRKQICRNAARITQVKSHRLFCI